MKFSPNARLAQPKIDGREPFANLKPIFDLWGMIRDPDPRDARLTVF
jgi:hypothetical protein